MNKILPISIPPSETLQHTAFLMGVIMAHASVRDVFYNSYINLLAGEDDLGEPRIDFTDATCEDYRQCGIGEMDLYYLENISKEKCAGFLRERLEQDNYLLMFTVDEFELSYSKHFQKEHFEHDTYIYGFDEASFYVMAYTQGHLRKMRISQSEVIESLYSHSKCFGGTHFCTFRVFLRAEEKLDFTKIYNELEKYLIGGVNEEGKALGISVYKYAQAHVNQVQSCSGIEKLNPKVFRMLWEHKKIMRIRFQRLKREYPDHAFFEDSCEELERTGSLLLMLAVKYNLSKDIGILERMIEYLDMMERMESYFLPILLENCKRIIVKNIEMNDQ